MNADKIPLVLSLVDGQTIQTEEGFVTLRHHTLGNLTVSSGNIVACDPLTIEKVPQPFEQRVELGSYPVVLNVAHFPDGDQRVACASLRIRNDQPVRWAIATQLNLELTSQGGEDEWSYGVESGTGCFADSDALGVLLEGVNVKNIPAYKDMINKAISSTYINTWGWANVNLEPQIAANIVAFTAGLGDGVYLTYIGYNTRDVPVCFTTDFEVLDEPPQVE